MQIEFDFEAIVQELEDIDFTVDGLREELRDQVSETKRAARKVASRVKAGRCAEDAASDAMDEAGSLQSFAMEAESELEDFAQNAGLLIATLKEHAAPRTVLRTGERTLARIARLRDELAAADTLATEVEQAAEAAQ